MFKKYHILFNFILLLLLFYPVFSKAEGLLLSNKYESDENIKQFKAVAEIIKKNYVTEVSNQDLLEHALHGMIAGLDPHSLYLNKNEYAELKLSITGEFAGLGILFSGEAGILQVMHVLPDSPAKRAEIKAGDIITQLNNIPAKSMSLQEATDMMRGKKGTPITLTILRKTEPKPLQIKAIRDVIKMRSVHSELLDQNFAYINIAQFQTHSSHDFVRAINALKKKSGDPLRGLILDLRNNPGGILEVSVDIADAVLDRNKLQYDSTIVYSKERIPEMHIKEKANPGDILNGAPIVVLVNEGSASAAEIVAGALQDHHRAIIIGTKTFGKGSIQTLFPIFEDQAIKLTTALYFTPAGRSIQGLGIEPDIVVENQEIPLEFRDKNDLQFKTALIVLKGLATSHDPVSHKMLVHGKKQNLSTLHSLH